MHQVLARSILLGPEEGPDKYLYMAQLHEGREALGHYEKGLDLLRKQLADGGGAGGPKEAEAALRQRACMAYCSVAELFMTDLCFEEDAEARCQVRDQRAGVKKDYGFIWPSASLMRRIPPSDMSHWHPGPGFPPACSQSL